MDTNPDLESFREQWRAEVRARNAGSSGAQQRSTTSGHAESFRASAPRASRTTNLSSGKPRIQDTDEDYVETRTFDSPEPSQEVKQDDQGNNEPVTALEHYERAVEKEDQGSLGDSLQLYRRAFRVRIPSILSNSVHADHCCNADGPQSRPEVQE